MSRKDIPEEILDDDVADFIGAASAAKRAGKKKFTFGGKEYPVTISGDVAKQVEEKLPCPGCNGKDCELCKNKGNLEGKGVKDAEGVTTSAKMGDAKAEELTSDARRKAFKEKLVKLGYKKKTNEERLLEKMGKSSSGYDLYHKDFSSAMKHAYDHAKKKLGIEIDPDEIDDKVAMGPKKPSNGKTNSYRLMGTDKKGKSRGVQIQVANLDNKKYELNMYKEEVELEEKMDPTDHVKKKDDKFCVYNADGTIAKEFDNKEDADKYAIDNHDKLMATAKKEEVELDEAMKNTHALIDTADGNKVVAMASSEKGVKQSRSSAHLPPMSIKNKNTLKIVTLTKPQSQKASEKMIGRALPSNMDKFPTNVSASQGKRMGEELLATIRAKHKQEDLEENKKSALAKKLAKASVATKKGKDKVTLKKAPWDKKEEVQEASLDEGKMSPDQIEKLKQGYESLRGKKISAQMGMKISRELEKLDKSAAMEIAKADIPFVSTLAINKLMMNFNMSGSAIRKLIGESVEELVELTKAEKDLISKMYDKKGNLTPLGKKVMDHGKTEELSPKQKKIDSNKNGKIDGSDLAKLRTKKEEVEMTEAEGGMKLLDAASELEKYAKKSGGIDKKDFMKAAQMMKKGLTSKLVQFTNNLDTEPREKIVMVMKTHLGRKTVEKMFGVKFSMSEGRKQVLAHGGKGQYKVVSTDGAVDVVFKGKVVGKGDYDRGADSFFISMKGQKGQKSFDDAQDIADYFAKNKIKEDLDEAISMRNSINQYYYVDPKGVVGAVGSKDAMRKMNVKQAKDGNKGGSFSQNFKKYKVGDKIKEDIDTFDVEALIESADKKDAAEMKEIVLAMNPKYNAKQVQQEVEKMAMEKYKNKTRAKKIASHVK